MSDTQKPHVLLIRPSKPHGHPRNDPHNRHLPSRAGGMCEVIVIPRLPAPRTIVVDLMVSQNCEYGRTRTLIYSSAIAGILCKPLILPPSSTTDISCLLSIIDIAFYPTRLAYNRLSPPCILWVFLLPIRIITFHCIDRGHRTWIF